MGAPGGPSPPGEGEKVGYRISCKDDEEPILTPPKLEGSMGK